MSWARKYRARTLDEYIGDEVKNKVANRMKSADGGKPFSVLLLHGMRGGGKTSLSRLLAKELLCENPIDGHACCECSMCQELDENLLYADSDALTDNVLEMNVAVDSGKSAIENTMEEMSNEPIFGKYKICILDEVQKASNAFQNALLKRLEEPKQYEIYILCTTNPEDLLQTVKSRCEVSIEIKPAKLEDLVNRLEFICSQEKIKTSKRALKMIANYTGRNPRESILKLEDIAKSNAMVVDVDAVLRETGNKDSERYMRYYQASNKGLMEILQFTQELKDNNIRYVEFINGLTKFTLSCINIKFGIGLNDYSKEYIDKVKQFFNTYTSEDIDCLLQILEYANKMINSDDSMAELVLNTTAMRISKIKLLAVGLQNEKELAIEETKKGSANSIELVKEETKLRANETLLDNALVSSALGKTITELKVDLDIEDEDNIEDTDDRVATDEEIFNLFNMN